MIEELLKLSPFISLIICLFTIIVTFRTIKNNKLLKTSLTRQYSSLFNDLNGVFSTIHQFNRKDVVNEHEWPPVAREFADGCKTIFDNATKSSCSVSLKIFILNKKNIRLRTLIRNSDSEVSKLDVDPMYSNQSISDDPIAMSIFLGKPYYLDNNIFPELKGYRFSEKRGPIWPVPYLSILTVPIKQNHFKKDSTILGLLIITSDKRNAFNVDIDLPIAQGLADGMADFLKRVLDGYLIKKP